MLVCVSDWLKICLWNVGLFSQAMGQVPMMKSCSATLVKRNVRQEYLHGVRAIFVWPWNENPRKNRNKKRSEIERFHWFIERIQTRMAFWLVKRTLRWKNFRLENFLEIYRYFALTSYCNTIGQSNNAFSINWRENKDSMFWSFHPLADRTNNEHSPKPFFKVIRKSHYHFSLLSEFLTVKRIKRRRFDRCQFEEMLCLFSIQFSLDAVCANEFQQDCDDGDIGGVHHVVRRSAGAVS